ncbi:hypothetical protein B0H13DRAFT_2366411 [Mycena leptocephala]|nr:hypothetical protein B0H13DRAFT_2366411 [Mycena leptocephala]
MVAASHTPFHGGDGPGNLLLESTGIPTGNSGPVMVPYNGSSPYLDHRMNTFLETGPEPAFQTTESMDDNHFEGLPPFRDNAGNTFSVRGNMTQLLLTSHGNSGLDTLHRFIAMGAVHDSGERSPEPACHPGTRTKILDDLLSWSLDASPKAHVCGGMQDGWSTRRIVLLQHGDLERGTWNRLFTTLAYQLALSVPGLSPPVQRAVEMDGLIVAREMELQFQRLIVEPFKQAAENQTTPILVIDGLDECDDYRMQQRILQLIIKAIRSRDLPMRILIASRPEPHIREVIGTKEVSAILHRYKLSANRTAYEDIRRYFQDEFSKIRSDCLAGGIDLGTNWPDSDDLDDLVKRSSGTFIYAITVIRFVSDQYAHPHTRLATVLNLDPKSTAPLDDLYTQILSVLPQEDQHIRILHAIWREKSLIGPEETDLIFAFPRGTSRFVLRGLHCLLHVHPIHILDKASRPGMVRVTSLVEDGLPLWCDSLVILPLPQPGAGLRNLYINLIWWLPVDLSVGIPSDELCRMLRDPILQNHLFLFPDAFIMHHVRGSTYPSDLVQLFDDLRYIAGISERIRLSPHQNCPTYQLDLLYAGILTEAPDLLFILSCATLETR